MTKDEALKLARRALYFAHDDGYSNELSHEAITAIKAALEAKDEPLQSVWNTLPSNKDVEDAMRMKRLQQLSTPPQRTWVGLTDGEISDCMEMSIQKTCRAIEAKLKEKNT
jgi:hypothetical protein